MAVFKVTLIINGNTIRVSPGWKWNGVEGALVKIKGYNVQPQHNSFAMHKLSTLLLNKTVDLKNASNTPMLIEGQSVYCSVYLNEIDVSQYFPELKTT